MLTLWAGCLHPPGWLGRLWRIVRNAAGRRLDAAVHDACLPHCVEGAGCHTRRGICACAAVVHAWRRVAARVGQRSTVCACCVHVPHARRPADRAPRPQPPPRTLARAFFHRSSSAWRAATSASSAAWCVCASSARARSWCSSAAVCLSRDIASRSTAPVRMAVSSAARSWARRASLSACSASACCCRSRSCRASCSWRSASACFRSGITGGRGTVCESSAPSPTSRGVRTSSSVGRAVAGAACVCVACSFVSGRACIHRVNCLCENVAVLVLAVRGRRARWVGQTASCLWSAPGTAVVGGALQAHK